MNNIIPIIVEVKSEINPNPHKLKDITKIKANK